jgi:DNA-binding GntR family transcriptional regulator
MNQSALIAEELERAIVRGEIEPGGWLRQEDIAERFGVSRMPVREAMKMLQARGLLEQRGRSAMIRLPSPDETRDLFLVRAELEAFAAERAATKIGPPQLVDLRDAQEAFKREAENFEHVPGEDVGQRSTVFESISIANEVFHDTIATAAGSAALLESILQLRKRVPRELSWISMNHDAGLLLDGIKDHESIIESVQEGASKTARQQMRRHVLSTGATIVYWLEGHGKTSRSRLAELRPTPARGD